MEEIQGKRIGTRKYLYEGYSYHLDVTSPGRNTYRCSTRSTSLCRGAVQVKHDGTVEIVHVHSGHAANPLIIKESRMRLEILQLCRESLLSFDQIFQTVSLRYGQAAVNVTLHSMRSAMKRERTCVHPRTPASLEELGPALQNLPITRDMFRGIARGNDDSVGVVFARNSMIDRLNSASELFIDATFRVVPRKPKSMQLLIIHIRHMDVVSTDASSTQTSKHFNSQHFQSIDKKMKLYAVKKLPQSP